VTLTFDLKVKNVIVSRSCKFLPTCVDSSNSDEYFFSYLGSRQTDRLTNTDKNIISFQLRWRKLIQLRWTATLCLYLILIHRDLMLVVVTLVAVYNWFVCVLFVGTEDTFEGYINRMRQNRTWGDENCLMAASALYKIPIWIFTVGNSQPIIIDKQSDSGSSQQQSATTSPVTLGFVTDIPGKKPNHYISLLRCTSSFAGKISRTVFIAFVVHSKNLNSFADKTRKALRQRWPPPTISLPHSNYFLIHSDFHIWRWIMLTLTFDLTVKNLISCRHCKIKSGGTLPFVPSFHSPVPFQPSLLSLPVPGG